MTVNTNNNFSRGKAMMKHLLRYQRLGLARPV